MYSTILRHIFYPIGEKMLRTKVLKYLGELEEIQWWSPEQICEMQNSKLRALVKHAYENVPYYSQVFNERGLTHRDIQTVEDLPRLPILTKDDIRRNFEELKAKDFKKWKPFLNSTSGSTGEPLTYYITMDAISINWAGIFRAWGWAGYQLGDKRVNLGGSALVPDQLPTLFALFQHTRWLVERVLPLSSYEMGNEQMNLYVQKIRNYKPRFVYGYPSAIHLLANYLKEHRIKDIQLQAVFSTAEMLLPSYRERIEEQFGCEVFDQYGCYDGGPQAQECPTHHGYHVSAEKTITEFLDENEKPVSTEYPGELITTDLHNYAMPFIRYAVGDMGTLTEEKCSCGRGLPLMKSINGRANDFIITPEGKRIGSHFFSKLFRDRMWSFIQYQVIQESLESLVIKVVPYSTADKSKLQEDMQRISDIIHIRTGNMNINVEFVDEIATTKAGKRKFIISKVSG